METIIPLNHFLFVGAALFAIGIAIIVTKKNAILVMMGIELMLNAANINMVAFSQYKPQLLEGQFFSLFIVVIAAAETALGLAIILNVYSHFKSSDLSEISKLKG